MYIIIGKTSIPCVSPDQVCPVCVSVLPITWPVVKWKAWNTGTQEYSSPDFHHRPAASFLVWQEIGLPARFFEPKPSYTAAGEGDHSQSTKNSRSQSLEFVFPRSQGLTV